MQQGANSTPASAQPYPKQAERTQIIQVKQNCIDIIRLLHKCLRGRKEFSCANQLENPQNIQSLTDIVLSQVVSYHPRSTDQAADPLCRSSKKLDMHYEKLFGQNPILWEILLLIAQGSLISAFLMQIEPRELFRCWDILNSLLVTCIGKWNSEAQRISHKNSIHASTHSHLVQDQNEMQHLQYQQLPTKNQVIAYAMATKLVELFNRVCILFQNETHSDKSEWLPFPLSETPELFGELSPQDTALLLHKGIWQFLTDHLSTYYNAPHLVKKDKKIKTDPQNLDIAKETNAEWKSKSWAFLQDIPADKVNPYAAVMKRVTQDKIANLTDSYLRIFAYKY